MKIEQRLWTKENGWEIVTPQEFNQPPQLVLVFGGRELIENEEYYNNIRGFYPEAHVVTCSTAGEILAKRVRDHSLSVTAICFEKSTLQFAEIDIVNAEGSEEAGRKLAQMITHDQLVHVMVFSDGTRVNGTALVSGLNQVLPKGTSVTGGLVDDGAEFKKTAVGLDHTGMEGKIVLIGFYGADLKVGFGSLGGWDPFGVERMITKSKGNVLYELDGKPALELYKTYLGEKASGLPGTGLLFPLRLRLKNADGFDEVVRTILAVDEKEQSLTFAGDMPEGVPVALMKANFDRLIDGASGAGSKSIEPFGTVKPELAVLVSCVGRKLVLKDMVEEEIDAVRGVVGGAALTGFYSYGELCPTAAQNGQCRLHNQTMTITVFSEN